jgi:predicted RND superfamily exporter protein
LAVVPLCGVPLNAILITMVPLVYVTGISGAIHLSNYYLEAARDGAFHDAPGKAIAHAAVPLFLAGVTTAVGLLSLCYSELAPIRLFGIFSAIGVVIGSVVQFTVLPAALAVWMPAPRTLRNPSEVHAVDADSQLTLFPRLGDWVTSRPTVVSLACLAMMFFLAAGLPKIETSIQMMRLFSPRASVIPMTQWLEQHLGATIPLEVLVRFTPESNTSMVKRMAVVAAIDAQLRKLPKAGGSVSAATFAPREITSSIPLRPMQRAVIDAKIKQQFDVLHEHGWVARNGEDEIWRISLRIRGIDDVDYSQLAEILRGGAEPVLTQRLGPGHPGVELAITGTAPIVFRARRSLLDGMLFGLGTDVVLIVVAVMVTTRSLLTGGVMLVLSIFPTTLVFGAMGWSGVVVDIGSVMTPCVAVGVTVDDVIHFLLCHRRGVQQGLTVREASNLAYRTCGRAMIQSWGIIGIGLSAFALSSFVPTFRFGMLMLLLLTAGLMGNLLFLPAVLAGPIGRWVSRKPLRFADRVHVRKG